MIAELQLVAGQLHAEITDPAPSQERIELILKQLDPLNDKLTKLEDDFSYTLGAGSRWLTNLILKLLLGLVLTVEICGLSLTILVSRGISKGLNEIISSSEKIAAGDFSAKAKVYSRDEIGILADSFNGMTEKLRQNIQALRLSEEALGKAKDLAEQAVVTKDHFLANMSHEIRTPMNAIIGFTDLLEHSQLNEEQKTFVQAIKISGQNLTTIINDILDYSRIRSGMVVLEERDFSLRKLIASLHVLLQQKALEKNLDFTIHIYENVPEMINGDPTRLTQILSNLTDNALKFTAKGSVSISAAVKSETEDSVTMEFRISDTGIGVSADKQAMIFERFTQESAETNRKYGGTGLGLSIVKSLVELHRGTITLQSEINKGSEFSLAIRYGKSATELPPNEELPAPAHEDERRPLRVLYAEDHPLNQMLVLHFSKKYKLDTDIAENGKIALEKMRQKQYDLILMDMQMPEMDGYEATRIIRNEMKSDIPIIALTAHAMSGEKEKCLELGMNDFVSKPFDPQDLYDKIVSVMGPGWQIAASSK